MLRYAAYLVLLETSTSRVEGFVVNKTVSDLFSRNYFSSFHKTPNFFNTLSISFLFKLLYKVLMSISWANSSNFCFYSSFLDGYLMFSLQSVPFLYLLRRVFVREFLRFMSSYGLSTFEFDCEIFLIPFVDAVCGLASCFIEADYFLGEPNFLSMN